MADNILIIANPVSGSGRGRSVATRAAQRIRELGGAAQVTFTRAQGDAVRCAQEALTCGVRRIAACGGDGTIHEIAGVLAETDVALGLLPCGRGNDFARALGVPAHPEQAADVLVHGVTKRIDLGRVDGAFFCTVVTVGFDSEVARLIHEKAAPFRGTAAYILGVIKVLIRYGGVRAKLQGDFGTVDQAMLLVATGNTCYYGGGMKIVPDASPEDGLLDVCRVSMMSRIQVLRMFPSVFRGGHVTHPHVTVARTRRLTIETADSVWLFADGEPVCRTPAEVEVAAQALTVITPGP